MRGFLLGAVLVGLLAGVAVTTFRAVSNDDSAPPAAVAETSTPDPGSSEGVAVAWAEAWSADDIPALYDLLHPEYQAAITLAAFSAAYDGFATETTLAGIEATVVEADDEGASVSVRASTRYFGVLEYSVKLRTQRDASGGRRVAWDTTAIHPELLAGYRFLSDVTKPERGAIYDRNGLPLAITAETRMLGLNRSIVVDRAAVTAAAAQLGVTKAQVDAAFASGLGGSQRVPVAPLSDAVAEQAAIFTLSTPGMLVYFETRRTHPLGAAAAHVVGYTRELTAEELEARAGEGYVIGDRVGAVGLEAGMDEVLAGKPGGELRIIDASGALIRMVVSRPVVPGQDIHTTLDSAVLSATHARLGGLSGSAVVLEPTTNAILALNSSPSYDPDAFERADTAAISAILAMSGEPLNNRATIGLYSAGSTFKLITGAAAMVYGGMTTTDTIDCTAVWATVDPPLRNWEGAQGPLTIAQGLMRSCNPVFYEIGYRLNATTDNALSKMAREFGFGAPTGVVGFYEEAGLVPDAEWKERELGEAWFAGDDINLAIGQGALLVTPLQLANAYSTFITGQLRSTVVLQSELATVRGTLPLTPEQKASLLRGLELVTSPSGTAGASFAGYSNFAGKSGTAEDANAQQHVLFVAFAPSTAPAAVAAVILDDGDSGSLEAGPIARDLVLSALP